MQAGHKYNEEMIATYSPPKNRTYKATVCYFPSVRRVASTLEFEYTVNQVNVLSG